MDGFLFVECDSSLITGAESVIEYDLDGDSKSVYELS